MEVLRRTLRGVVFLSGALTLAACSAIFDSYYPQTTEYLESQIDLRSQFSGSLSNIQMRTLSKYHDYLVIEATGGEFKILVVNTSSMSISKTLSASDLQGLNGGSLPPTYPITEEAAGTSDGLAFGEVTLNPDSFSAAMQAFSASGPSFGSQDRAFFDGAEVDYMGSGLSYASAATIAAITSTSAASGPSNGSLQDMAGDSSNAYLIVRDGSNNNYLYKVPLPASGGLSSLGTSLGPFQTGTISDSVNQGFATKSAAVFTTNFNNDKMELRAYDWSGKFLSSVEVQGGGSNGGSTNGFAFAFDFNGQYWYEYDPSTGRLSKLRTWW